VDHPAIAHAGFDDGYLDSIDVGWARRPHGQGPTGVAIRTASSAGLMIWTDPNFRPWRDEALRRGYGSSFALPLKFRRDGVRPPSLYADRPHAFDEQTRSHFHRTRPRPGLWGDGDPDPSGSPRVGAELRRIEAILEEGQRLTPHWKLAWNIASRGTSIGLRNYRIFGLDPEKDAHHSKRL